MERSRYNALLELIDRRDRERIDELIVDTIADQEYRLCLLELGIEDDEGDDDDDNV